MTGLSGGAGAALRRAPLALTMGEPAGIGPDIALLAWLRRADLRCPPFYVIGDVDYLAGRARALGLDIPVEQTVPEQAASIFLHALPVSPLQLTATAAAGHPDASSAPVAIAAIRRAVDDFFAGRCSAIVTNPVAKNVLYGAGFADPGHTEFLAKLAQEATGTPVQPVMLLWCPDLAVVPVTVHLPLKDVPARLTKHLIETTGRIVAREMSDRFGIPKPRLVAAGLNPHAGENGALGDEDRTVVGPALHQLAAEGIDIRGPLPADTLFHAAMRASYDVALCMYHDQALIPIKTLAFETAVNVTLGLPFVRTSPDHGTAFDIAGTGRANPDSLISALNLAARLALPQLTAAA